MLGATLILAVGVLTLWALWRKKKLSLFRSLNIPGPKPNILFGNFWELLHEGQANCINKWIKQYGRVFGYYYGLRPVLIVADPDLLKTIQQKEFQKFSSRPALFQVGSSTADFNKHAVTTVNGKKWKDIRSIITPTFTVSKLKMMSPIMNEAVDELVEAVEKESNKNKYFDIYKLFQNLTMDVIARTSLGIHSMAQANKKEPLIKLARIIVSLDLGYLQMLTFSYPEFIGLFSLIRRMLLSFYNKGKHPRAEMVEKTAAVIQERRKYPDSRRRDVLQLLMDAQKPQETVNESNLTAGEDDTLDQNDSGKKGTGRKLSDGEILQNATVFLLAGYETTSTALAFATHLLAHHQDIQEKVRDEIRSLITEEKDMSYDIISKCQYLDKVLNESLRIYPPITYFVNRMSTEDIAVENLRIPKDVAIQVPVYTLHHDPEFWDNPEEFNPERFSVEEKANRNPMAFQPFGAGPRNCVGMRFAQMEAKMALAKLLNKYRFKPKDGATKDSFEFSHTILTLRPKYGIIVQVERV